MPIFHTNCPDGSHFAQTGSHFAQNTTPNPYSLLSSHTHLWVNKTWIFDGRIDGDMRWTAIEDGKRGDWKQHADIQAILACLDGISSLRLENWLNSSSDPVNRGKRPPKVPAQEADGGTAGDRLQTGGQAAPQQRAPPLGPAGCRPGGNLWSRTHPSKRRCAQASNASLEEHVLPVQKHRSAVL